MRSKRLGTPTLADLTTDGNDLLQNYTEEEVTPELWRNVINRAVYELWDLEGWKNMIDYEEFVPLPLRKTAYSNHADGSGYDDTTQVLTVPLPGTDGVLWTKDIDGFDVSWLNSIVIITDTSTGSIYNAIVSGIEADDQVSVTSQVVIPLIAAADLIVQIDNNPTLDADEIDLTQIDAYENLHEIITAISDKGKVIGPPLVNSRNFDTMKVSPNRANQILFYRAGEKLYRSKGKLPSYGVFQLHIIKSPMPMVEQSDKIDVKNPNVNRVLDYSIVKIVNALPAKKVKMQLPQELVSWYNRLQASKKSKEEEEIKR